MRKSIWLGLGALVAVSALFAACGGDDDDGGGDQTSEITTNHGAAVQAIVANLNGASGIGGGEESADLGAPATGSNIMIGGGGSLPATGKTTAGLDRGSDSAAPALQEGGSGLTVQGFGSASADADSAVVEFYFGGNYAMPSPMPEPYPDKPIYSQGSGDAITEADLQPVIDALVGAGVSRDDIEIVGQPYYDPYYSSATLRATINDMGIVDGAVQAATDAGNALETIYIQSTNVTYTLQDCTGLQRAALTAAAEDAADRGALLAEALGVGLGGITGASSYSYYGYGSTSCGSSYYGPYPMGGVAFAEGQTHQVEVYEQITVTYAMN